MTHVIDTSSIPHKTATSRALANPAHTSSHHVSSHRVSKDVGGHDLGRRGEDLAADYLTDRGLVVLSRNWRCRDGELDVVATDGRSLVVCEVKTRTTDDFGDPAEFVTATKMRHIRLATQAWLRSYRVGWCEIRFDVVAVLWPAGGAPRLRHLRGAF